MTQPIAYGGRPIAPAAGAPTPELRVARFRGHARGLFWSALVLMAAAGAVGYFFGNPPAGLENWVLPAAAGAIVLVAVVWPFVSWWTRTYLITTRRVIVRSGMFGQRRREYEHVRGYSIGLRRSILQRMWGAGTLTLANGVDEPLQLVNVPSAMLVHEALVDQVEVNQILAHRDAQSLPLVQDAEGGAG
ncbi:PH domain-containing protein [Microbacterium sp. BWT-B31]|uniref:PH domain-containing protein n=1 Tax=Microbacterium sp. BWT-B31 TaxID=3232072 RepID=UPI0035279464